MANKPLTKQELVAIMSDPFYCINIAPGVATEHEPMIDREIWIANALLLMTEDENGNNIELHPTVERNIKEYLHRLLRLLEGAPHAEA